MIIDFKHCGNIDSGQLTLQSDCLNIKYGANGVGKSTMARALALSVRGESLDELLPFKERDKDPKNRSRPTVTGGQGLGRPMVFNEDYVQQFVFTPDDLVKNSFEVFVRTEEYDAKLLDIEQELQTIKEAFERNETLSQVLSDLGALSESFGKSKDGYAKNSKLAKAIGSGNKVEHVPERLAAYTPFIQSESNAKWIGWQIKGNEFLSLGNDSCPYCTESVAARKETVLAVAQEYDAKSVEHLIGIRDVIERLGEYFAGETRSKIHEIVRNKTSLSEEEINYLKEVRNQVDTLHKKLSTLHSISFFLLRDVESVITFISSLRIDLDLLDHLQSEMTKEIVDDLNSKMDTVLDDAGKLQGAVNIQRKGIQQTIEKHAGEINFFLRMAGYRYVVEVVSDGETYKMRLRHVDCNEHIDGGRDHLSFGERNAFALVLFMYECLRQKSDLIILDDPISSFDKNKKYAVMEMLFRGTTSLRGMTAVMFTHDMEPVIDMVKTLRHTFAPVPVASFLSLKGGEILEKEIRPTDLQTFAQICRHVVASDATGIIKAIYLRRHYEIVDDKGGAYHVLASLLHGRAAPTIPGKDRDVELSTEETRGAESEIRKWLPEFDYDKLLAEVDNSDTLRAAYQASDVGYEKLQLFRMLNPVPRTNQVMRKFVNETFHIENEFVAQLSPRDFDPVPEYIITECDSILSESD